MFEPAVTEEEDEKPSEQRHRIDSLAQIVRGVTIHLIDLRDRVNELAEINTESKIEVKATQAHDCACRRDAIDLPKIRARLDLLEQQMRWLRSFVEQTMARKAR
jgi:hypothetical protein